MEVSSPDKIMFADRGLTKADLVGYYRTVANQMAPLLVGRPLTLHRFPRGVGAKGFMQKNVGKHYPSSILRFEVSKNDGGTTTFPVIAAPDDIAWLANQNAVAFHIWLSAVSSGQNGPKSWLVLDLDPPVDGTADSPESGASPVMAVARAAAEVLVDFGLASVPVVTGSKGVHVWIPAADAVSDLSVVNRALAGLVVKTVPALATTEFLKRERQNRVFVDWLRANRGATVVAPLSIRATAKASVAVPVDWSDLEAVRPDQWTLTDAEELAERPTLLQRSAHFTVDQVLGPSVAAGIEAEARRVGVDLDTPFDRFGRKRS